MASARTFRFEALLRLRQAKEDEQKRIVAARRRKITSLQRRHDALLAQVRAETDGLRACLSGSSLQMGGLRWGRHWLGTLRRHILEIEAKVAGQQALLAGERVKLVAARKDTRVLDRLRERQRELRIERNARRERRQTDDLNLARYVRAGLANGDDGP